MTQELNYTEYIERYLQNQMPLEEIVWFEKEIEGNPDLQAEIDFHMKVDAVLTDKKSLDLKNTLDKIHNEIDVVADDSKESSKKRRISPSFYSIITIIVVGAILFATKLHTSTDDLISDFYKPEKSFVSYRGDASENNLLPEALDYYENHNYSKAIVVFEQILASDPNQVGANLYSGIAYLELKNYEKANINFQRIINLAPNPFVESAKWYLGLCYLFTDEREKAKEIFTELADAEGVYSKDARKIMKRI